MECYKKPSIAVLVPLFLVLAVYALSSLASLSTPDAPRSLQNGTESLEMLALMTKCTCMEGSIFCSDVQALRHCNCEGPDDIMMVQCEERHVDYSAMDYEWAAVFSLGDAFHTYIMQEVNGAYADSMMRIVLIPTSEMDVEGIHTTEEAAAELFKGGCAVFQDGESTPAVAASGSCFDLTPGITDTSMFNINTEGLTGVAMYTAHLPFEFERDMHFFKDSIGNDIEPVVQEGAEFHNDGPKPWGKVILVSILINLTTLSGTVVIAGHWLRKAMCKDWNPDPSVGRLWINVVIPMFAAGALLATAFFLLLPEALHIIGDGLAERLADGDHDEGHRLLAGGHGDGAHVEETDITWRWGASIMGGFLFPVLLHGFFPQPGHDHGHTHANQEDDTETNRIKVDDTAVTTGANASTDKMAEAKTEDGSDDSASDDDEYVTFCCVRLKNLPLFLSFNLGEALHCFTDGIFVGAAYMGCGNAMGNSVAAATIAHEIPNQLAGYLVMVNQNGINPCTAILLNFLFGMIVLVGALVVLVAVPGNVSIGSIFAIGAGIFIHVAATEMLGLAERSIERPKWWLYVFLSFFVGAVLIGLVLLDHVHCGGHHH